MSVQRFKPQYRLMRLSAKGIPTICFTGSLEYLLRIAKQWDSGPARGPARAMKGRRWIELNWEPAVLTVPQKRLPPIVIPPQERIAS